MGRSECNNETIVSESHLMYYSYDLRLVSGRLVVICLWGVFLGHFFVGVF